MVGRLLVNENPLHKTFNLVRLIKGRGRDCKVCEKHTGMLDEISCKIHLTGELDEFQRERIIQIARHSRYTEHFQEKSK